MADTDNLTKTVQVIKDDEVVAQVRINIPKDAGPIEDEISWEQLMEILKNG